MYNLSRKDYFILLNMLEAIEKIKQYCMPFASADDFFNNSQAFDASLMNFIIIGEMVEKLSNDLLDNTENKMNWLKIKGFRNILAHNYFGVDAEEVWQIVHHNLPKLETQLKELTS